MALVFHIVAIMLTMSSFVYCFLFVDVEGKGKRSAVKRFIYRTCPEACLSVLVKLGCEPVARGMRQWALYLCYSANPMIQIVYLVMAVGGYYLWVVYGFCHLPNTYRSEVHRYISIPLIAACYWSYYKACTTDPGYLNKDTNRPQLERAMKRYDCDNMLFSPVNWCETCNIPKPARSKHCGLCNMCCEKMDHHCVWVNTCVGLHNYKYFLLFLLLHTVICLYGIWVAYGIFNHLIDENDMWNQTYMDPSGKKFPASLGLVISNLVRANEIFSIACFLCCTVTVMLFFFLSFHTKLIMADMTTNEYSKHGSIQKFLEKKLSFLKRWEDSRLAKKPFKPSAKALEGYIVRGDLKVDMSDADLTKVR